jgi:hypothetical protein
MNTDNKNKFADSRRFYLLLAVTLLAYPALHRLTISESSAAQTLPTSKRVEVAIVSTPDVPTYLQPGGIKVLAEGFHSLRTAKLFLQFLADTDVLE